LLRRRLQRTVLSPLHESPERLPELRIDGLQAQHDVDVLGGSKRLTDRLHGHVARSATDDQEAVCKVSEVIAERLESVHHRTCSISCSRAWSTRSSPRGRMER